MPQSKILEFLSSDEWDAPFFKRLAHNDTSGASGHQGGPVIPKDLRRFFPTLDNAKTSKAHPTVDRGLWVEMFLGLRQIGESRARYQFQTWGGKRAPESRLTDNLAPIHKQAQQGDILVFQRSADMIDRFRLLLFHPTVQGFSEINHLTGGRRWGPLIESEEPVTTEDLEGAVYELEQLADEPFVLKTKRRRIESRRTRVARSSAFPQRVSKEYNWTCAVSGVGLKTPSNMYEAQAAHVVPVSEGGTDDIRNGLALSHTFHWAFDWGLFGIRNDRRVYLPNRVSRMVSNAFLRDFAGRQITEARNQNLRVHEKALAWHRTNRVKRWE